MYRKSAPIVCKVFFNQEITHFYKVTLITHIFTKVYNKFFIANYP